MGACGSRDIGEVPDSAPRPSERGFHVEYNGPGPWHACMPDAEVPPRVAKMGVASSDMTNPTTLMLLFGRAAQLKGDRQALLVERPLPEVVDKQVPPALPREEWTAWTYAEYLADVRRAAKGFVQLGMQRFQSVNIWGFNAPEWTMAALAAGFAGGKCAGLYPTDTPETAAYKVVHSCGSVLVVEDRKKMERVVQALAARKDCSTLKAIVAYGFEPEADETVPLPNLDDLPVLSWKALLQLGEEKGSEEEITRRVAQTKPGHCAALIYTSGTTGEPKAVMISHDNIIFETMSVISVLGRSVGFAASASEERMLSYLPLSHVAGFMVDIVAPLIATAEKPAWAAVFFARPYDLKEKAIRDRLCAAKPTIFLGVPLVWERVADTVRAIGQSVTGVKKSVATWAKRLSLDYAKSIQLGGSGERPWGLTAAETLVLNGVKARLGLDECKFGFTGAAPIRVDTLEFFGSLGLLVNEVYGMSECTGACSISTPQAHQWGSCGWEMPGVEVKAFIVDPTDLNKKKECPAAPDLDALEEQYQGELCFRGRNIMMGYMACPAMGADHIAEIEKKTAEAIDAEGWLHSGDKGMITSAGMIKITGRYKELIIGEGGENIAPVPIEDAIKKGCNGIAEVMMIGDKRKYNIALVTLKAVGANGEVPGTDTLDPVAKAINAEVTTISAAMDNQVWIDTVKAAIEAANKNGKVCPNNAFKIQKFTILPTNFSEEAGELTPTKKLKRKVVEVAYAALIDKMYASDGVYVRYPEESVPAQV